MTSGAGCMECNKCGWIGNGFVCPLCGERFGKRDWDEYLQENRDPDEMEEDEDVTADDEGIDDRKGE